MRLEETKIDRGALSMRLVRPEYGEQTLIFIGRHGNRAQDGRPSRQK